MATNLKESAGPPWRPETEAERRTVREQLERILASPLFRNSRRYPNLLRFAVEHALSGETENLKERRLGVEVFGRSPDYDTNADPVVRTTAVEIRKRISQYYALPEHEEELRIDLPSGTYLAEFRMPAATEALAEPEAPESVFPAESGHHSRIRLLPIVTAVVLIAGAIAAAVSFRARPTPFTAFWSPIVSSPGPALLCLSIRPLYRSTDPPPAIETPPVTVADAQYRDVVAFSDAVTLSELAGVLRRQNKSYRIRRTNSASFDDLRDGPVVLIGAFNNQWSQRLAGNLRFSYVRDGHMIWIQDRRNPARRWTVNDAQPISSFTDDYALISRVMDPMTGRFVLIAGGLLRFGTLAAGEFLTDPRYLEEAARSAHGDWSRRNLQIVIATRVVGQVPGPPRIVASEVW